jgi:signal transduction histidine kinase/sugar phosphate isomerase/epimerase
MNIGYQTIIWGHAMCDLEEALQVIFEAGYAGVEFAQPVDELGSPERLRELLAKYDLKLLGLAGGSLWQRMDFARCVKPLYLYVEEWDPRIAPQAVREFALALHPHVYTKTHCLEDGLRCLEEHPELRWLPDTAHLWVVNDNPVRALEEAWDRLIGVHIKDWTPEYGRSSHRYARGFTELGKGCVDNAAVIRKLQSSDFGDRWLVVEQDQTATDPSDSACISAEWLIGQGVQLRKQPKRIPVVPPARKAYAKYLQSPDGANRVDFLRSVLSAAALDMNGCYRAIGEGFHRLVPSYAVALWAFNPRDDALSLLAVDPEDMDLSLSLAIRDSVTEIAIERQSTTLFDLTLERPGEPYHYPGAQLAYPNLLIRYPDIKQMIAIPLMNPYNANHLRAIVTLFPKNPCTPADLTDLFSFGTEAARAIDAALDERCVYAAGSANLVAGRCTLPDRFNEETVKLIARLVNAEGCSLFLVDQTERRLEFAASTVGITWHVPREQQSYARGEGLTGNVWARHETLVTSDARTERARLPKSSEDIPNKNLHACLFVPMVNPGGKVLGVVRCRNNTTDRNGVFSYNDAAIVDAVCQVSAPHLEVLLSEQRRARAIARLTHELQKPIVTIRGACDWIKEELRERKQDPARFFGYDYVGDIESWSALMLSLVNNAQFYGLKAVPPKLRFKPTLLMADIIAPAVRQMGVLIRGEKLPEDSIWYGRFETIPALSVDRERMFQVVFNLLSNAIKYRKLRDPLRVRIDGARKDDHFEVTFQDWGIGIPPEYQAMVFEEGVRGPRIFKRWVAGQGLGLWVARQIIEAHKGSLELSRLADPTELVICLPQVLARSKTFIRKLAESAMGRLEDLIRTRGLQRNRIDFSGLDRLPPLWIEPEPFGNVFYELLSNSINYAHKDRTAFNVMCDGSEDASGVVIRVRDTGVGVDPGQVEDIFQPYARRPREGDPLVEGRGMGLALCREIIEQHGGRIACTSPGNPTEFMIWLGKHVKCSPYVKLLEE